MYVLQVGGGSLGHKLDNNVCESPKKVVFVDDQRFSLEGKIGVPSTKLSSVGNDLITLLLTRWHTH